MSRCPTCNGFGTVTYAVTQVPLGEGYFRDEVCPDCEGMGEVDPCCTGCGQILALNEEGECERCHDASTLPIAEFDAKYGLTEVRGDPFLRRVA